MVGLIWQHYSLDVSLCLMMMLTKVVNESSCMTASEEEDHYKFGRNLTRWNLPEIKKEKKIKGTLTLNLAL